MNDPFKHRFLQKLSDTLERYEMLPAGGRILVALSGGPDSTVLLDALHSLGHGLAVCHVNHGFRGEASDEDEKHVIALVEKYDLALNVQRFEFHETELAQSNNLEERARILRYEKLVQAAQQLSCSCIATGHTQNDQAETVLQRLSRSTGISGLCGIYPVRHDLETSVIRPMLFHSRDDVLEYARHSDLSFRLDSMNRDTRFTRVRIRETLLPLIREHLNPNALEALSRLAQAAQADEAFWTERIPVLRTRTGPATLQAPASRDIFLELSQAERGRLLRSYFAVFGIEPSWAQIDAVQSLLESERPQSEIHLNATCRFYRRYGNFYFAPPQTPERISEAFSILIPGECDIEPLGIRVVSEILPVSSRLERPAAWTAEFDADKVRRPVLLRTRRPGDTIRPLGMTGVKKVKKIMQERRLPREERERVPLIRFGDETAWIAGCCFSETFRIDQNTQSILRMTLLKRPFE